MRRLIAVALLAVVGVGGLGLGMTGCTQGVSSAALIPAVSPPVADVPIPAGFYMASESRSSVTPATSLRFVDHYYKGSDSYMPVVRFYRDQLPAKGWTLVSQQQIGDKVVLNYTKGSEDLTITIDEGVRHTHVNARIVPSSRGPAK